MATPLAMNSPLVNRLRSRKTSGGRHEDDPPLKTPTSGIGRMSFFPENSRRQQGRSKAKHVEFSDQAESIHTPPRQKTRNSNCKYAMLVEDESDLTELESSENEGDGHEVAFEPSPRRLRSKDRPKTALSFKETPLPRNRSRDSNEAVDSPEGNRRITPMRKAKQKKVFEDEDEGEGTEESADEMGEDQEEEDEMEDASENGEEDEVDELVSSRSVSPSPIKSRLRPRKDRPNDVSENEDAAESESTEEGEEGDEEEEPIDIDEPKVLRNGKVVGEDGGESFDEDELTEEDAEADDDQESEPQDGSDADEGDEEGDSVEEEGRIESTCIISLPHFSSSGSRCSYDQDFDPSPEGSSRKAM